ncbi:MAG: universal stress protein [Bacteroidetes bacterium]|nr:universal stress protein [Bacteroidota bacterium]
MKKADPKTILVPTDFSPTANKALEFAINITKITNGKLVLMNVVDPNLLMTGPEIMSFGYMHNLLINDTISSLKDLAEEISYKYKLNVEFECLSGSILENIIKTSKARKADLIIMGTHGTSGVSEWLFGSNAFSVVNSSTIPVLTVNIDSKQTEFKKIVFPYNENLLTLKKSKQVIEFAKLFNASILLFGYSDSEMFSSMAALRKKGEELIAIFKKEGIHSTLNTILAEDYADEILRFANSEKANLITIVTNRSHSIDKVFKTKPDKKLVNHSDIPIYSVPVK